MDELLRYGELGLADRNESGIWHYQRTLHDEDETSDSTCYHKLAVVGKADRSLVLTKDTQIYSFQEGLPDLPYLRRFHKDYPTLAIENDVLLEHLREDYALEQERRHHHVELDSIFVEGRSRDLAHRHAQQCFAIVLGAAPSTMYLLLSRRHMDLAKLHDSQYVAYFDDVLANSIFQHDFHDHIRQLVFAPGPSSNYLAVLLSNGFRLYQVVHDAEERDAIFHLNPLEVEADAHVRLPNNVAAAAFSMEDTLALLLTDGNIQVWQITKVKNRFRILIHLKTLRTSTTPGGCTKISWSTSIPGLLIFVAGQQLCTLVTDSGKVCRTAICAPGERITASDCTHSDTAGCDLVFMLTTNSLQVFRVSDHVAPIVAWAHYRAPEAKLELALLPHNKVQRIMLWSKLDGWATIYTLLHNETGYTTMAPYAIDLNLHNPATSLCVLPFQAVFADDEQGFLQLLATTQDAAVTRVVLSTNRNVRFHRRRVTIAHGHNAIDETTVVTDDEADDDGLLVRRGVTGSQCNLTRLYQHLLSRDRPLDINREPFVLSTACDLLKGQLQLTKVDELDDKLESLVHEKSDQKCYTASLEQIWYLLCPQTTHEEAENQTCEALLESLQEIWMPQRLRRRDAQRAAEAVSREAASRLSLSSVVLGISALEHDQLDLSHFRGPASTKREKRHTILDKVLDDWRIGEAASAYTWHDLNTQRPIEPLADKQEAQNRSRFQVDPIPAFRGTPVQAAGPPAVAFSSPLRAPSVLPQSRQPQSAHPLRTQLFKHVQILARTESQEADESFVSSQTEPLSSQIEPMTMTQVLAGPHGSRALPGKKKKKKRAGF